MANLQERFDQAKRIGVPELWSDVERRVERSGEVVGFREARDADGSPRQRITAGLVAAAVFLVAAGFAWSAFSRFRASPEQVRTPATSTTAPRAALGFEGPQGWDSRIVYQEGTLGPVLEATNYGLPPAGSDFYSEVFQHAPAGGISIRVQEFVGICGCDGFADVTPPIVISPPDVEAGGQRADVTKAIVVGGQYLSLFVEFGSRSDAQAITEANAVLARVTVDPSSAVEPAGLAETLPPVFGARDGWYAASVGGAGDSPPIAWASTIPFVADDLRQEARAATLFAWPSATLKALGQGDVVIVADWGAAHQSHGFPVLTLPLNLADAEIQNGWEGQVAENVPMYFVNGRVGDKEVEVRAFFGTQHPDAAALDWAQSELDGLTFPEPSPSP